MKYDGLLPMDFLEVLLRLMPVGLGLLMTWFCIPSLAARKLYGHPWLLLGMFYFVVAIGVSWIGFVITLVPIFERYGRPMSEVRLLAPMCAIALVLAVATIQSWRSAEYATSVWTRALFVAFGVAIGNFLWQATYSHDWAKAVELSFFQTIALLAFAGTFRTATHGSSTPPAPKR